jgi:Hypervirulence associated proteins TUDOR domain
MVKDLKRGDRVSWSSHGGMARGKVVKKVTSAMTIKGHKVAASRDNPEYLVETDEGKQAAYKAEALSKD